MPITDRSGERTVAEAIDAGLERYNVEQRPDPKARPVTLAVEEAGEIVGGLVGRIAWRWLRIDVLWVHADLRGRGLGQELMETAERLAREQDCLGIHLDTFDFQAPDFYRRLGYECFGELADYPPPEKHYYFKKMLG